MKIPEKHFTLKDGREALLRTPTPEDAAEVLAFITKAAGETDFLLKTAEEFAVYTVEQEAGLLQGFLESPDIAMILCVVDGRIAGNCQIVFLNGVKVRHRATVAIAVLEEFWNQGIGTAMFGEMTRLAADRGGIVQLELDFVEGNSRARHLYEKQGFRITGVKPNAIRLREGSLVNEYMMIRPICKDSGGNPEKITEEKACSKKED